MSFNTNETLNGTDGKLWINDVLCATVQSFVLKQKNVFEDINKAGQLSTSKRIVGVELTGTISKLKTDNVIAGLMKEYADGNMPDIKLIGLMENKTTGLMQRAVIKGVTFDENDIMTFEQKKVITEEIPYCAESYYYQDLT